MTQSTIAKRRFDVAIFVATDDEHKAVLNDGEWHWEIDAHGGVIHVKCLKTQGDFIIQLALRKLLEMGAEACVLHVSQFLAAYECGLVAMVGVCAGIKGKVKRCDIVIPGKVASICNGKETAKKTGKKWKRVFFPKNRDFRRNRGLGKALDYFYVTHWESIAEEISKYPGVPGTTRPALHFTDEKMMAQVFHVRAYSGSGDDLKKHADRNVHALEMESAALAYAAEEYDTKWLVIKGVQDFADVRKNDKYRQLCAWASYRTLTEFVACCLDDFWQGKVRIVTDEPSPITGNKDKAALIKAYRSGDFNAALQIGERAFKSRPYDGAMWEPYLQVLMRCAKYHKAGDLIDVADYHIRQDRSAGIHFGYRVRRAEYYWRIGFLQEADKLTLP